MKTNIHCFVLLILFPLMAEAQIDPDALWKDCLSEGRPTTAHMNECTLQAEQNWDRELNSVYQQLINELNDQGKGALRLSQRQWICLLYTSPSPRDS